MLCSGCKSSFSILGNALLDFKELACSLYPLFLWCYTKDMLHFQKKEKAFMSVQTVVSSCECVCRHSQGFARRRRVVYLPLFVLVWLVWMRCLGAYAQRDFQASWRECGTFSALLTASGVACEEVGVAEMEFFGLKCTLKVNTALRRKLPL